jgi:hypothetical protein
VAGQVSKQNSSGLALTASILVILMLGTSASNLLVGDSQALVPNAENNYQSETVFTPEQNLTYVEHTNTGILQVPRNQTITDANLSLSSMWNSVTYQNSTFGNNQTFMWNGDLSDTEISPNSQNLILERVNTANTINDFEVASNVPSDGWLTNGLNGDLWTIVQNNSNLLSSSNMILPNSGYQNTSFLSTTGNGDINSNVETCINSPIFDTPRVINNYSLTFQHWLALDSTDTVSVNFLDANNEWVNLPFASMILSNPNSNSWHVVNITLDPYMNQTSVTTRLQFCLATSQVPLPRGGWFIDELSLFNEGGSKGAWFHGNFSGDYLPYATSEFIIPANLSNFPYLDELEINANWDLQGYLHDYLTVEFSFDNGTSWNTISGNYGIPGLGIWHNGNLYYGESNGWVPIYLPIVHNFSRSGGLNHTLFKFTVFTNAGINFGGAVSSGWEGIAIDQLIFHHKRGTSNGQNYVFKDFNSPPSIGVNSTDGWLPNGIQTPNQWQWTQSMGLDSQKLQLFSFDSFDTLPLGWAVSSQDNNKWSHGEIPTRAIYGPDAWSSGQYGIGIQLDGKYTNEMYTHLVSPEYSIPSSASARLTFNSWVCTEANWDGGAVSVSTDGGINWWYLPAKIGDFHDQISTANTNSPFYGEGIFDGSTITNGCRNSSLPFQFKQYDISNLSGSDVRFRFSFFSDQLIELDGWYLDDVGIEVDVFEQSGEWLSQPIYPDENFGWSQIDGLISQPNGTQVSFDIIDKTSGSVIDGYSNRTLPIELLFDPLEVPSIQINAKLSSDNHYVTPSIEKLEMGVSSYFDAYHATNMLDEINHHNLDINEQGHISADILTEVSFRVNFGCPSIDTKITSYGYNMSYQSDYFSLDYYYHQTDSMSAEFVNEFSVPTLADNITITFDSTSNLNYFHHVPQCVLPSRNISIGVINNTNEIYSDISNSGLSSIFQTGSFSTVMVDEILQYSDNYDNYQINLQTNQILNLSYQILDFENPQSLINNAAMRISGEIESNSAGELRISNSNEAFAAYGTDLSLYNIIKEDNCYNRQTDFNSVGDNVGIFVCTLSLQSSTDITLKLNKFSAISSVNNFLIDLDINQLNSIKHELENQSMSRNIDFPIFVKTDYGSLTTKFSYKSYLHQIDRIIGIDEEQWLPGQEISIQTSHWRFNPVTMSDSGFGFDSILLTASEDNTDHRKRFAVEARNLDTNTPSFSMVHGGDIVSVIDIKSNADCNGGYCLVNWTLQSSWYLDDINDIAWMVNSTDLNGLVTGPGLLIRDSQFNEIENDLEIFELSILDSSSNRINDWTNQNWPYRISQQNDLTVSGTVRFEGINSNLLNKNDAEVEVRLTAIPPLNVSGGQNEWHNEAVDWSYSWFTEISDAGVFTTQVTTPNIGDAPSNTTIQISVHLSRIGPIDEVSINALDQTSSSMNTRFIFDVESPSLRSVNIYDPSGLRPADGHIWTLNQDIPIQVTLEDVEGLDTELVVYSWSEYSDDTNGDSIMDQDEYRITTVSVNYASNFAVLDIPAFSWQEIKGPFESGRLSLVFTMQDLAGNALIQGGDFGESNDAVTILVQDQLQTLMDSSSLSLDLVNGSLLPSFKHSFTYSITDYNGIESLDKISLALVGREIPDLCNIDYTPRTTHVVYDANCFSTQPEVVVSQISGLQKWLITTRFVIDWEMAHSNPELSGIPSLKLFDDGQDLQLGTSYIRGLSWDINAKVNIDNIQFIDNVSPIGPSLESGLWVNPGDAISAKVNLQFNDSNIQLDSLSPYDEIGCKVNNETQLIDSLLFENGQMTCQFIIPSNTLEESFLVELWVQSSNGNHYSTNYGTVLIDRESPILMLELKDMLRLDSTDLSRVLFEGTIAESSTLINQQLTVNWDVLRDGLMLNQVPFANQIALDLGANDVYQFSASINLSNIGNQTIVEGDELVIWLTLTDNSGQELLGFATLSEPLIPRITWIDFEPKLSLIELRTDNPMDGESLIIATRIVNAGLEFGNATVVLSDIEGRELATRTIALDGGKWELIEWDIEAWTTGDIEIIISLENYSESQSLLVEDVEEFESKQQDLMGTIGLVVIFLIIVVGGFSYAYVQRAKELEQYTKHHLDQIAIRKQERDKKLPQAEHVLEEE